MRAIILNASAGSGKTYQLAYKYVHDVIEQPGLYRHILAVTFTNKATEEMKSRILKEIHLLASGAKSSYLKDLCNQLRLDEATVRKRATEVRSRILHDYSRFTVLTIDTFFQRILRAFIKELGIDLNYNVEIETASILAKSADTLIEQITIDRDLKRWLTDFVQERIDEGSKWDIRDGILALSGELFKEKNKETLSLARSRNDLARIVSRASKHAESTQKEFRDTAAQAVKIITDAGLKASDFADKSRSFAHWFFSTAAGEIKAYSQRTAQKAASTDKWAAKGSPAQALAPQLQPLLQKMCDIYDLNIRSWNTYKLLRENYRSFALLSDLYSRVKKLCDEQNMMLLSETKYILSEFIGHNDAPFIYEKVGNRFERFMIDEFQDTSTKEWENFLPLLQNAMAQSEANTVLIVGDIKQSIYRWRGGDWKILHEKAQEALGQENTLIKPLRENWRSLRRIVTFNNQIIARIVAMDNELLNETLKTAAETGAISREEALSLRNTLSDAYKEQEQIPQRKAEHEGYVSVESCEGQPPIVERICELIDRGFRPCDIMILVRGATDGAKVAAALLNFKQGKPDPKYRFDVMTQEALIIGAAPVSSFVTAALKLALNPDETLARAVYNHYLGHPFDRELQDNERDFFRSIRLLSPEEAFERIVMQHHLEDDRQQTAYLQAIHEQIIAFCSSKIADIALFLRWWEESGKKRSLSVEESVSTVEITTIHKAKGLEKPAVIIPYCTWSLDPQSSGTIQNIVWAEAQENELQEIGRFPVRYKKVMADSGFSSGYYRELVYTHVDNINLLYVALTRAAESLHIFVPQTNRNSVGKLLLQCMHNDETERQSDKLTGNYLCDETGEHFTFGEFTGPVTDGKEEKTAEHVILDSYPTAQADLRLRLPSQRYFEDSDEVELSPRNLGILLHKAFEQADDEEGIYNAVEEMQRNGMLAQTEATTLRRMIAQALARPEVHAWFDGSWQRIRNEQEIILPGKASTRRPDRVMIRGREAVIVDYKFGEKNAAGHQRQMREYLQLLGEMGYSPVKGYLWYVKLGKIGPVILER